MHDLYELWAWTILMTSQGDLLSVSGGMGLHSCIAQVGFERGDGVVSLCYEDMWIYACMIWIVSKSDSTCYNLWTWMFPCLWVLAIDKVNIWYAWLWWPKNGT